MEAKGEVGTDELVQCVNFHKAMNQRLHVDEDEALKLRQKEAMAAKQSQLERLTEVFSNKRCIKDNPALIVDKDAMAQVQLEFEKFNDKDLLLLNKIVEVYSERVAKSAIVDGHHTTEQNESS